VAERYQPGQDVDVKVVKVVDFGAFVEIEKGVEGLVHISQISRRHINDVSKVLKKGDEIRARILEVDPEEKRIRLSIRALEEEEEEKQRQQEREERQNQANKENKDNPLAKETEEAMVTIGDVLRDQLKA
jgi:small subunit ribosomal protein S1